MRPDDFWALSALEWRWLAGAGAPEPLLTRAEALRLVALYPDEKP